MSRSNSRHSVNNSGYMFFGRKKHVGCELCWIRAVLVSAAAKVGCKGGGKRHTEWKYTHGTITEFDGFLKFCIHSYNTP
jgi:hypothetical protein